MTDMPKKEDPCPNKEITGQELAAYGLSQAIMHKANEDGILLDQNAAQKAVDDMVARIVENVAPREGLWPRTKVYLDDETGLIDIIPVNADAMKLFELVGDSGLNA